MSHQAKTKNVGRPVFRPEPQENICILACLFQLLEAACTPGHVVPALIFKARHTGRAFSHYHPFFLYLQSPTSTFKDTLMRKEKK